MKFFHAIGHFFSKLFGAAPSVAQRVSGVIKLVAPLLNTILFLTAGESSATEVASVISETQTDLAALAALCSQASAPGQTSQAQVTALLNSVQSNLQGLLVAGHIKDPKTLAQVTAAVNTIIGELEAITQYFQSPAPAPAQNFQSPAPAPAQK